MARTASRTEPAWQGARLIVERTDFISVPVTDLERSTTFYRDTLGLEQIGAGAWPEFQLGENVSLYLLDPTNIGQEFTGPHTASIALRVGDVEAGAPRARGEGRRLRRRDVRHRRLSHGALPRSRRQRAHAPPPLRTCRCGLSSSSATALCRCRRSRTSTGASPTSRGSIRTAWAGTVRRATAPRRPTLLEIDAAALAQVGEQGLTIERAPEGVRFERLTDDHPLLGSLVQPDDKFRAHNAALWEHGLLVHVPRGVVVEKPLYVRVVNTHRGWLAVLALARRRRGGEPLHA